MAKADRDYYDRESTERIQRFHHFPLEIQKLAMDDPALHRLVALYANGEHNYVDILEKMVIHQSKRVKVAKEEELQRLRLDTSVIPLKPPGPPDPPPGYPKPRFG